MKRPVDDTMSTTTRNGEMAGSEQTTTSSGRSSLKTNHTTNSGGVSARNRRAAASDNPSRIRLADDRTPWRTQVQVFGTILLGLVIVAIVALFYLNVSAKTAAMGRKIQFLTARLDGPHRFSVDDPEGTIIPIEEIDIRIAGLRAELAELTSLERVERRAAELGLKSLGPDAIIYLRVPGYQPREAVRLAPEPASQVATVTTLLPAYRSSLLDELGRGWNSMVDTIMASVISASAPSDEVKP